MKRKQTKVKNQFKLLARDDDDDDTSCDHPSGPLGSVRDGCPGTDEPTRGMLSVDDSSKDPPKAKPCEVTQEVQGTLTSSASSTSSTGSATSTPSSTSSSTEAASPSSGRSCSTTSTAGAQAPPALAASRPAEAWPLPTPGASRPRRAARRVSFGACVERCCRPEIPGVVENTRVRADPEGPSSAGHSPRPAGEGRRMAVADSHGALSKRQGSGRSAPPTPGDG